MARWRFRYDQVGEDGLSTRQHLEFIARKMKKPLAMLSDEPKLAQAGQKIWRWFQQVQRTRGGGFGPAPLTHKEIRAWYKNMRIRPRPEPWEIELILMLGDIQLDVWSEQHKGKADKGKKKRQEDDD